MTADADLLRRYLRDRDDAAFAAIVRKHGPMVFAACRRITPNRADAEDAFQATFLVLATKAEAVRPHSQLGAWLHGVAVRCAKKARDTARRFAGVPLPELPSFDAASSEPDLPAVIDDALAGIPNSYRAAVVLCHLEGRSRAEAAKELGWSEGTLSGRLHRALKLLGERLSAKGVTAAGAVVLAVLSARKATASVPLSLVASTCSAAGLVSAGFPEPGPAHSLARGVLRAMLFRKLKLTALVLGVMGLGAVVVLGRLAVPVAVAAPVPAKEAKEAWKKVVEADHGASVSAVAAGGNVLVTVDGEGKRRAEWVRFWNAKTGENAGGPKSPGESGLANATSPARRLSVDPKGTSIAFDDGTGAGYSVGVTDNDGSPVFDPCFPMVLKNIDRVAVSADTSIWATRMQSDPYRISLETRTPLTAPKNLSMPWTAVDPDRKAITHAALSADGGRLATVNADGVLRVYERSKKELKEVSSVKGVTSLTALKLTDDGKRLAVVGEKGFASVYDADKGKEQCELKGHDGTVAGVVFTPDGTRVATANGKTVRVFDAASGRTVSEWEAHADDVTCLAFTPDGKRLVTGSKDKTAKVWERE